MNTPKRHHFVPEMLLRRFTDASGRLHYFDRRLPDLGVRRSTPTQLFCETHLYSETDQAGVRSPVFEARLSGLESVTSPIIDQILEAARAGKTPGLTVEARDAWDDYFSMQWRRVPDSQRDRSAVPNAEQEVLDLLALARKRFPDRQEEVDRLSAPEEVRRLTHNGRVGALARPAAIIRDALASRGLAIVHITDPRLSFVVGSLPVVKLTRPGQTDLRDHEVEMWLPIASDTVVGVGLKPGTEMLIPTCDQRLVRRLNAAITLQSRTIAAASAPLIRALAKRAPPMPLRSARLAGAA